MIDFRFGRIDIFNFNPFRCTGKYTSAKSHHFTGKRMDRENHTSPKTIPQSVVIRFVAKSGFYQILFFISFLDCLFGECIVTFSTVA